MQKEKATMLSLFFAFNLHILKNDQIFIKNKTNDESSLLLLLSS